MDFKFEMSGDRALELKLGQAGAKAEAVARETIGRLVLLLQTQAKFKLSGEVLNVRTGRLRRSITKRIEASGGSVSGIVGTNVSYAAAHEFGFDGTVNVREHLRQVREHGRFSLQRVKDKDLGVWRKRRGKLTGGVATVHAHTRHVNLPERSFLRSALKELHEQGVDAAELQRAMRKLLDPIRK